MGDVLRCLKEVFFRGLAFRSAWHFYGYGEQNTGACLDVAMLVGFSVLLCIYTFETLWNLVTCCEPILPDHPLMFSDVLLFGDGSRSINGLFYDAYVLHQVSLAPYSSFFYGTKLGF